jgi:DNA polymerase elongation subunit (family B)
MKMKIGDYTVPRLPEDEDSQEKTMKLKNARNEQEYYLRCLPAQVQCAEKMRRRGKAVEAGSRLEFVVTNQCGHKAKKYENIESAEYFANHSETLTLDYMYYLKQLVNPVDQVLNALYVKNKTHHDHQLPRHFILSQYKYRLRVRGAMLQELKDLFRPKLQFK